MTDPFVPDGCVICPYDSNHSIAQSRLQRHIIKCSKNFPPGYRLSCPYNATHRLPKSMLEGHIKECPDRQLVEPVIYEAVSALSMNSVIEAMIECDENWDREDDTFYEISSISDYNDLAEPMLRVDSYPSSVASSIKHIVKPRTIDRASDSRSQVSMTEESECSVAEDMESVRSFMCIGRGRPLNNRKSDEFLCLGRGRGIAPRNNEF